MAKCKYVNPETGERCGMDAQVLGDGRGFCCVHDPTRDDAEKRAWRAAGGKASRRIKPWTVPELLEHVDHLDGLESIQTVNASLLKALVQGELTPSQARAAAALTSELRQDIALQVYKELAVRVQALEGGDVEELEGPDRWTLSEP